MTLIRRRWIAVVFLACWALGPAHEAGLSLHALEHHEAGDAGSREIGGMALTTLHGHFHEQGTHRHSHEAVPPSATVLSVPETKQRSTIAGWSLPAPGYSGLASRTPLLGRVASRGGPTPLQASLQDLCILRL